MNVQRIDTQPTRYIVEYTLPYFHQVQIGVTASREADAIAQAQSLFDAGDIWNDTVENPLLYDDYEESAPTSEALIFTVVDTLADGEEWPARAGCVKTSQLHNASPALLAAAQLALDQFEQMERIFNDDAEFCAATLALRSAIKHATRVQS